MFTGGERTYVFLRKYRQYLFYLGWMEIGVSISNSMFWLNVEKLGNGDYDRKKTIASMDLEG